MLLYVISHQSSGIETTIHKFLDTKGQLVFLPQKWQIIYHHPRVINSVFSPQVFHQSCGEKIIIFRDQAEISITNWNQIDIPNEDIELNIHIVQNLRCIEDDKEKSCFFGLKRKLCWKM